jgi:alkylhydroperoxidase/carboxymuconolactone decarboxylase family protein YurZ
MDGSRTRRSGWLARAVVAMTLASATSSVSEAAPANSDMRCALQETVAQARGASPSPLERARRDCPLLGAIIEEYATRDLGKTFPEEGPIAPSREIVVATRFATLGDTEALQRQARLAREAGATTAEFREMLYLTAVNAGLSKAIEAIRTLSNVLNENRCPQRYAGANLQGELR